MNILKVGACVLNQTPFSWQSNKRNILNAISLAKDQGVHVLCLPELCISGYGCEDSFHGAWLRETALETMYDIVPHGAGMVISLGLPIFFHNALFNSACLLVDGKICGFYAKQFLAGDGIHYEPRWFKAWPSDVVSELELEGNRYPLGDIFFDCGGVRIGFEVCEDAWAAARPAAGLATRGVDIILNPSASHFAFGKFEVRKRFVLEGSRAFGVTYVYSNLLGNESGRAIYDGGAIIASGGKILALGERFSFKDCVLSTASVDLDATRSLQARSASFKPQIENHTKDCVRAPITFAKPKESQSANTLATPSTASWEQSANLKNEEFLRAVCLGLFDYLRKSYCNGFVVSLSGGVDSSAVSCLVALMIEIGVGELGLEAFIGKLGSKAVGLEQCKSAKDIVKAILICIYQATENSSAATRQAAQTLSRALNATFMEFDIAGLVKEYLSLAEKELARPLSWETDDIALQNIQARARSPGAWLIANLNNFLLLSTSNRSEAAVGYATMDGDTSGSLSPIAGIDKAFLRSWSQWLEKQGPFGLAPIPELKPVNSNPPTAELRPRSSSQTDEGDLMPYGILDKIERAAVLDKQSPTEIFMRLQIELPETNSQDLLCWIERFFTLWSKNQWKRERYAPSFHLDDESLDPKTWCRFPILSGGFKQELQELREHVVKVAGK